MQRDDATATSEMRSANLARLPFREQQAVIDEMVVEGRDLEALVTLVATLRDPEPLAYCMATLASAGQLPRLRSSLERIIGSVPDTVLDGLLRSVPAFSESDRAIVVDCALRSMGAFGVERATTLCLIDRWLKHVAPLRRAAWLDDIIATCQSARNVEEIPDALLLQLPGKVLAKLTTEPRWKERLSQLAERLLQALEQQPKSLSQANAEQLLAHRVYAGAGHFFFELLQNAEDAGAHRWEARIGGGELTLRHDGTPFDAKDVVGVVSIGQTTKRADQIGFFGVGFKSVHEVCDRPRVHSGIFHFEVAAVSIPRQVEAWRSDETLLVLPLRASDTDGDLAPPALYERACAVPPETLLTLASVRTIHIALDVPGESRWRSTERHERGAGRVELHHAPSGSVDRFLLRVEDYAFDVERREVGRAQSTPVAVALALDEKGLPTPLRSGPTVFSYLPTGERSGLRFLVHAHFDVPVDRERLERESVWNREALAHAGALLAGCGEQLSVEAGADPSRRSALTAWLRVVPRRQELGSPLFDALHASLVHSARHKPVLVGAAGELLQPSCSHWVEDERLREAVRGVDLDDAGGRALAFIAPRECEVALELGARMFGADELVRWLAWRLTGPDAWPSELTDNALPAMFALLGESGVSLDPLADLELFPDRRGVRHRAADVLRADDEVRQLYGEERVFLRADLDEGVAGVTRFLDRMRVRRWGTRDVMSDLRSDDWAHRLGGQPQGAVRLLELFRHADDDTLAELGALPVFLGEHGGLHPLTGKTAAWLAPAGELGRLVTALTTGDVQFVATELQARFELVLARLGARVFEVDRFITALRTESMRPTANDANALHGYFAAHRSDLTARERDELARAPVFVDRAERLRPIVGAQRASFTDDAEVIALWPAEPWLDTARVDIPYVMDLGAERIGADAVVESLLDASARLVVEASDSEKLRRVYAYLTRNSDKVASSLAERLALAPQWLTIEGERRSLLELRTTPTTDALARLYQRWAAAGDGPTKLALIEGEGAPSALELARALRLDAHLLCADHRTLVADLVRDGTPAERLPAELRAALLEAPIYVTARELAPLAQAAIFPDDDGVRHRLGDWDDVADARVFRASGVLKRALAHASLALVARSFEDDLGEVMDLLGKRAASVEDLLARLETDPAMRTPAALAESRAALAEIVGTEAGASLQKRLAALKLWPTTDGRFVCADDVARPDELRATLGEIGVVFGDVSAVLDGVALNDAKALAHVVTFRKPSALVLMRLREDARPGAPLEAQVPLLGTRERLLALLRILGGGSDALLDVPLAVDARGLLQPPRKLWWATHDEVSLVRALGRHDLGLLAQLADPAWSAAAEPGSDAWLRRLPARRLLAAIEEASLSDEGRPVLPELFGWLLQNREAIAEDVEARSALGRARVIPSSTGVLCAPTSLVLERELPDLGLGWGVADEVPSELVAWLAAVFALDRGQLDRIADYVLDGHHAAAAAEDGARSQELLDFLARTLALTARDDDELLRTVRRLRLHKRLKIESNEGSFERPRRLLLPTAADRALIETFSAPLPACASTRYADARTQRMLVHAGASPHLDGATLADLMRGKGIAPGLEARLALASHVATRAFAERSLRSELVLDRRRWVPNQQGTLCSPAQLYWPDDEVTALLGAAPALMVHARFVRSVGDDVGRWLPFRRGNDVAVDDVVSRFDGETAASEGVLEWLEAQLERGAIEPAWLRDQLRERAFLTDESGTLRAPRELVGSDAPRYFADWRGNWGPFERLPRLAAALRIQARPNAAMIADFCLDVAAAIEADGPRSSVSPDLLATLPACLARLATSKGAPPARLPIVCSTPRGQPALAVLPSPKVYLPEPVELTEVPGPLLLASLPDDARQAAGSLLERYGVTDLWPCWRTTTIHRGEDRSADFEPAVRELRERLRCLWVVLPRLAQRFDDDLPWTFAERAVVAVEVVESLVMVGELKGERAEQRMEALLTGGEATASSAGSVSRLTLVLTRAALDDALEVATTVTRHAICDARCNEALLRAVVELLEREDVGAMRQWLDEHDDADANDELAFATPKPNAPRRTQSQESPASSSAPPRAAGAGRAESPSPPGASLLDRVRSWFRGDAERAESPGDAVPDRPRRRAQPGPSPDAETWFRPERHITAQLGGQFASRSQPPPFGFAFAPSRLPMPWSYAPRVVAHRFVERDQSWHGEPPPPEWASASRAGHAQVAVHGRAPAGEVVLPMPLYGRIDKLVVTPEPKSVTTTSAGVLVETSAPSRIRYRVWLDMPPAFDADEVALKVTHSAAFLAPMVPDEDLPDEVHRFLDDLAGGPERAPFAAALEIRDFVRARYRYDPTYLEDPHLSQWLARITRGSANAHIAALHASRDSEHLGGGVCYELNVLACELLRRHGIPAAIATGWVFDRGSLAEPDHLWAMALLPTRAGPRWFPVDAATTLDGRPLRVERAAVRWRAAPPPRTKRSRAHDLPRWAQLEAKRQHSLQRKKKAKEKQRAAPLADLLRILRYLEKRHGFAIDDMDLSRQRCAELLDDPRVAERLLRLLTTTSDE